MKKISKKELSQITKMIEKEFPEDPALQQVHIARQIIRREVELNKMDFGDYVRLVSTSTKEKTKTKSVHQ